MEYKLIALDLDGTLLNEEKIITEETETALINAQRCGVKVAIASGRMPFGVEKYAEQLQLKKYGGYCVCFNGGLIIDRNKEVLYKKYIDRIYLKEICCLVKDTDITVVVHYNGKLYGNKNRNHFTDIAPRTVNAPLFQVDYLYKYANWDFHKILLVGEKGKLQILKDVLTEKYPLLDVYFSTPWFLEIMPKGVDKGTALKKLCEIADVNVESTIACGDNFNDKSMLEIAGLGVVMANGEPKLKENADYVTHKNCNENGIAEVINKFIFKKI